MAHRDQWSEHEARGVLSAWRKNGQSLERFAKERGLVPQRIRWWRSKLEKDFARRGFPLARSTMNDLLHRTSERTQPLWQRLVEPIRMRPIVGGHETRLLMQNAGTGKQTASSGPSSHPTTTATMTSRICSPASSRNNHPSRTESITLHACAHARRCGWCGWCLS
jgi:hypothetical protein